MKYTQAITNIYIFGHKKCNFHVEDIVELEVKCRNSSKPDKIFIKQVTIYLNTYNAWRTG